MNREAFEMKKYWRVLVAALLAVFLFSFPACAEETAVEPEVIYPAGLDVMPEDIPDPRAEEDNGIQPYSRFGYYDGTETELLFELEGRLKEALLEGEPEVNVSDLGIDCSRYKIYRAVYFSPYLSNGIDLGCYYNRLTNTYTRIEIENPMSLKETKQHFLAIDSGVKEILQQVSGVADPERAALLIHDYFVYEYEYDYDNLEADTLPEDSFRSGGIIKRKIGVCQAYAYAYSYILNHLGIECHVAGSDAMNHAWNILKLDGSYYHVDCTWDDPVRDRIGEVSHAFFLLSDSSIMNRKEGSHYGWDLRLFCRSSKYDRYYWSDALSQIIFSGNSAYYIKNGSDHKGSLFSRDLAAGTERNLKSLGTWSKWGAPGQFWEGSYSGLFLHDGELYYNTAEEIRKISLGGQGDTLVYAPDLSEGYVYGSRKSNGQLEYLLSRSAEITPSSVKKRMPVPFAIAPAQLLLSESSMKVAPGKTKSLTYSLVPSGTASGIRWSSDQPGVAGVDQNGVVTGVSEGTAVVTARADNGVSASCTVVVSMKKYRVTFDANGGKVSEAWRETEIGSPYGTLPVPSRAGYRFAGWYTLKKGGSKVEGTSYAREKDHTLYARWTANTYKIRYHKNGASGGKMADTSCTYGSDAALRANKFTKKGYTFAGWATKPGGSVVYKNRDVVRNLTSKNGGVKTLYAKWTPKKYKITYKLGGGKNNKKNPKTYRITSSTVKLKNPARKGYTFKGWYSDSKYKKKVTKIKKGSTGNRVLYARWKKG